MDDSDWSGSLDGTGDFNDVSDYVTSSDTVDQSAAETNRLFDQATTPGSNDPSMGGDNNSLPVVSTTTNAGAASALQLLGSAGTTATQLGTALGNIAKQVKAAPGNFSSAFNNASNGNALSTWLANASTTDKLLVGLSIIAIFVAIRGDL